MVECRIYVEGGGENKALKTKCRKGFNKLFEKAGLSGRMPKIIACGTRHNAYDDFFTSFSNSTNNQFVVLLIDSEGPIHQNSDPWSYLTQHENWSIPINAIDENLHFMVQCMESWFLSDLEVLQKFFRTGFNNNSLPGNPQIEEIPKDDVLNGIIKASRHSDKGIYNKGEHSFEIIGLLDPTKIEAKCPYAKRLFITLKTKLI